MPTNAQAAIEAARQLLPAWCVWWAIAVWPTLAFLVALAGAALATAVGSFPIWRLPSDAPWTERARASYPVRSVAGANTVILPLLLAVMAGASWGRIWVVPRGMLMVLTALAAFLPAWLIAVRLAQKVFGRGFRTRRRVLGQLAFTYLLKAPHAVLALVLAATLPAQMDRAAGIMICAFGTVIVWFVIGGGAFLLRRLGLLRPVSPTVAGVVARAGQSAGIIPRGVYQLDCAMSNAFALWGSREIVFSDILLDQMSDAELEAIAAHELAHLTESRASRIARLAACLSVLPLAAAPPIIGSYGVEAYLPVLAFAFVSLILIRRFARRMEERADRQGHAQQGDDGIYARGLEKIYCANLSPAVLRGNRHIHPHLYDRMVAAGVVPVYERPAPPSRGWRTAAIVASLLPLIVALWAWDTLPEFADASGRTNDIRRASLALRGSDHWAAWVLCDQAANCEGREEAEPAIRYLQASTALDEQAALYPAQLAAMLAYAQRCREAEEALSIALKRQQSRKLPAVVRADERAIRQARAAINDCGR